MSKLKVLDLFSGIGGFSLGLERTGGFETVAFCEIEESPRKVLRKHWPEVPIYHDVRKLTGQEVGAVDVICGGYPCQPFSTAGKRKGKEDDRHLWPEFSRIVAELRPTWVIGENVAGHISMGLDDVLSDLEGQGYAARAFVIPACGVDAPHRRYRCWIVGNAGLHVHPRKMVAGGDRGEATAGKGANEGQGQASFGERVRPQSRATSQDVADAMRGRQQGQRKRDIWRCDAQEGQGQTNNAKSISKPGKWLPEPRVGRVANGVPGRVDRLKALGNAVVPQIPEMIGHAILEAHHT